MNIINVEQTLKKSIRSFSTNELAYLSLTSKSELTIRDKFAWGIHNNKSLNLIPAREFRVNFKNSKSYIKIDMVTFNQNIIPQDLIEFKVWYTADFFSHKEAKKRIEEEIILGSLPSKLPKIIGDYPKMEMFIKNLGNNIEHKITCYSVIILVHPNNLFNNYLNTVDKYNATASSLFSSSKILDSTKSSIVKYLSDFKKTYDKNTSPNIKTTVGQNIQNIIGPPIPNSMPIQNIVSGNLPHIGSSFGIGVDIMYWIIQFN
jgi:hypothetical protein